jgi:hypothetical protein
MRAGGPLFATIAMLAVAALFYRARKPVDDAGDQPAHGDWPNIPSFIRGNSQGRTVTAAPRPIQRESVNGEPQAAYGSVLKAPMGGNVTTFHSSEIRRD